MQSSGLRRKDTTKGPPLRILSLDGGGVRGYSMLILLQELMHRTYVETEGKAPKRHQIPKPCEYFDLIAGTGTGGLIAIMLGRLRLDLETCKEVYGRMTKRVFETDKTIAGIPYRSTLFKASKLEEAIKECVRTHTIFEDEGNDGTAHGGREMPTPSTPMSAVSDLNGMPRRSMSNASSAYTPVSSRSIMGSMQWGNPNAYLYDSRENRTKTAVSAIYKGTPKNGTPALLRSYDSRKEPAPEFDCTIWQAGRATSAIGLAFKPIQIGHSVFIDEGAGKYNPSPQILDEAAVNEWPGREIGVFVSVGTGKRPGGTSHSQHEWWEGFVSGSVGDFAEARRRLISKIEGCEETHQYMLREHLYKRGVNEENYFRLNVEVGVGEFGMNEWNRVTEISTSTRMYLQKPEIQRITQGAAAKLARVELDKRRQAALSYNKTNDLDDRYNKPLPPDLPAPQDPLAVELPGDDVPVSSQPLPYRGPQYPANPPHPYLQSPSSQDKFTVLADDTQPPQSATRRPLSSSSLPQHDKQDYRLSQSSISASPRHSHETHPRPGEAPPLPPKTPIDNTRHSLRPNFSPRGSGGTAANNANLPYPDTDGPPPVVNMARKPEFVSR